MFLLAIMSRPALGTIQPPVPQVSGALSPGIKQLGCEVDLLTSLPVICSQTVSKIL